MPSTRPVNTRNEASEFARRTHRNLELIEQAAGVSDGHPITQLTLSLLGLVVIPKEKDIFPAAALNKSLEDLQSDGWPRWRISQQWGTKPTQTLEDLLGHVRNAVAHGHLFFMATDVKDEMALDSTDLNAVVLRIRDSRDRGESFYWEAEISAHDLRTFCMKLLEFIRNSTE